MLLYSMKGIDCKIRNVCTLSVSTDNMMKSFCYSLTLQRNFKTGFQCIINATILFLGVKAKVGSSPFLKCATPYPLIMWHPYARHYYFCVTTEKEQQKWYMVLQDCVRHSNNGESC